MNKDREERVFDFEFREDESNEKKLVGYAAVFNKFSQDLGGFVERIQKGAFKKTIKDGDIRALFNHDVNYVIGRNKAGTLKLKEDDTGLRIEIYPSEESQTIKDLVLIPILRGDIDQMSFGFRTIIDKWTQRDKDLPIRDLIETKLYDISPVTFPAYLDTSIEYNQDDFSGNYDVAIREYRRYIESLVPKKTIVVINNIELLRKRLDLKEKTLDM